MAKSAELDETKRIMGRLVSTPPKPHDEMTKKAAPKKAAPKTKRAATRRPPATSG